jgi:signal peptidase II
MAILIACVWLLYEYLRSNNARQAVAFTLIVSGAIGNAIDRVIHGAVIDFIDLYIKDFQFPAFDLHISNWHWPAFNVADSAVVCGVVLLCINALIAEEIAAAGRRKKDQQ